MSSPAQAAAKFDRLAQNLVGSTRDGVNAGARLVHQSVTLSLLSDIGADSRMSGLGRKKFGGAGGGVVAIGLRKATSPRNPTALVAPSGAGMAGAWGILEGGAVAHIVGGKTSSKIARRGKKKDGTTTYNRVKNPKSAGRKLLNTPWGPKWGPFMVAGSPAKRTFSQGVNRVRSRVPAAIKAGTREAIFKAGFK